MASLTERCEIVPGSRYLKSPEYDITYLPEMNRLVNPACSFRTHKWLDSFINNHKKIARGHYRLGHRDTANHLWHKLMLIEEQKDRCAEIGKLSCLLK